jgi:hypothetical protein
VVLGLVVSGRRANRLANAVTTLAHPLPLRLRFTQDMTVRDVAKGQYR